MRITVLCANPAVDVTYRVEHVERGSVHPVLSARRRAGGKGTNTARVLAQLGADVALVAPLGGAEGERYAAELAHLDLVVVPVAGPPRTSVCVMDGEATVFNESGPALTTAEWDAVVSATIATAPDVLVLAGSLPPGAPPDAYAALVRSTEAWTVVDAKGAALRHALIAGPDVVTPNLHEAQEILGSLSAAECARRLHDTSGAAAVVSSGSDGLTAVTREGQFTARLPAALAGNPTGAGDALTAALALGRGRGWPDVLRDAVATSAAALASDVAGEIDLALRATLLDDVVIEEVGSAARADR